MDLLQSMKNDIRITEYAQAHGYTLVKAGTQYTLKEHDSIRIDPEKNLFIRNSDRKTAGSIIDFAMWVKGVDQREAIKLLRSGMRYGADYIPRPQETHHPPRRRALALPVPTAGKYSRVYAYLNKSRCIDNGIIGAMMKRKLLYEDDHHNCVFVGFDYDQAAAFATKRSTMSDVPYRGDAAGSRKEVSFFVNNNAPTLFVTEAPIDAMSMMSMLRMNGRDESAFSYLALCGVSDRALLYHMSRPENQGITRIYLATDNDDAGSQARTQLRESLKKIGYQGTIIDKVPKGKDWNDDLIKLVNPHMVQEKASQQKPAARMLQSDQTTFERGMEL